MKTEKLNIRIAISMSMNNKTSDCLNEREDDFNRSMGIQSNRLGSIYAD